MLDIRFIRENRKEVESNLKKRGLLDAVNIGNVIDKDGERRSLITKADSLRAERNRVTDEIAKAKQKGKDVSAMIKTVKEIPERIKGLELRIREMEDYLHTTLMAMPNMLHESVPEGTDEKSNRVLRFFGKKPKFSFNPKGHLEILEQLQLINRDRAEKIAGRGFFFLHGRLVLLDYALMLYGLEFLAKKGFRVVEPPYMINRKSFEGVTDMQTIKDQIYKIEGEDLYLIGTSEHVIGSMFAGETFLAKQLPSRFCGVSPCFRKEVGAHGKYTKGLFRMHHFNKAEQFIFCTPGQSWKMHEELQKNAETLVKNLGLHGRVILLCSGDTGVVSAKTYDTELWMADNVYREVGSNSNCTDYQARRLGIKYREGEGKPPKDFVHTLNSTAIATSRVMIAIIEQNQKKDGSVAIPKVLWKYTGFKKLEPLE